MLHHYPEPGVDCAVSDSSRWWQALSAPELRLVIGDDAIECLLFDRPWLPGKRVALRSHHREVLVGEGQDSLPSESAWQRLHTMLAPLAGQRWHVVIVLSNQYARWLVLPWQAEILSEADKAAYYRHGLQQAFGADACDWQVQAQGGAYGQPTLLNALPLALINRLQTVLQTYHLAPGVITSAWTLSANQSLQLMRQQRLPRAGWIICRESGSLTMACLMQGYWQQMRQIAVDAQWAHTLKQCLLREQVMYPDRAALPVYLSQAALRADTRQMLSPFQVVEVQPSGRLGASYQPMWQSEMA
ncbi:hypothetical protein [Methylophilus medardicus]|uniref:Uncharacterized protein n=1 Tax=Methylophilus medardicus TaxID=2588534 RepID=A0A5B8CR59_9PROT|nr:hypothetical protein [Methylophilus medardicus]QDC43570.1 hypothetical protein FIU01_02855 [Methylophilus medardicus]QDC48577.1 hypothetical protein FIU00_02855 [Methylophilus medardicus]QDC52282.1 hypothetical protein FIT99_02855 [Methylophilus medardicus]